MQFNDDEVVAGQAVYTKSTLPFYDLVVMGISNQFIWRCPTARQRALYDQYVTVNHLDVGAGTGYYLDHCRFPTQSPRLALLDLNLSALDFTAKRIARYHPETYQHNILEPIEFEVDKFDSVSINYLLHCLPGTMQEKTVIFEHLQSLMNPDAVLFGSTLLQSGVTQNWASRRLMAFYNRRGIFSNREDSFVDLQQALTQRFREVSIEVVGCAAIFATRL